MTRRICCALGIAMVVGSTSPASAHRAHTHGTSPTYYYDVVDLGGAVFKERYANALSDSGWVAGGLDRSFRWDAQGHATKLPPLAGYAQADAWALNDAGVAVGSSHPDFASPGKVHATLWTGTTPTDLGTLGGPNSIAYGINDAGHVVGLADAADGGEHAFLWKQGIMSDLGTFAGHGTTADDINASDTIVGTSGSQWDDDARAFIMATPSSPKVDLGTLGGMQADASAINDLGDVTGSSTLPGDWHAFLWEKGVMHDLGVPTGANGSYSWGHDVNDAEQVVGSATSAIASTSPGGYNWESAFIWQNGVMTDLNELVSPTAPIWLFDATSISDTGRIVGWGPRVDDPWTPNHAFLLVPRIHLVSLSVSPQLATGSATVAGAVTMNMPAPPGGATVFLTNTFPEPHPGAEVPGAVTVPPGAISGHFVIPTDYVKTTVTGTITARYDEETQTAHLTVRPVGVKAVMLAPNPASNGQTVTGKVLLTAPAGPSSVGVALASSNPQVATLSATGLSIPAGSTVGTFTLTAHRSGHGSILRATAVVTASANGMSRSRFLTVQ